MAAASRAGYEMSGPMDVMGKAEFGGAAGIFKKVSAGGECIPRLYHDGGSHG